MPVLQTVGLCGILQEVSVRNPKQCEVGMRCVYRCRLCVHTVCLTRNPMETKWQEGNGEHHGFSYFPQHYANNNNTVFVPL